MKRNVGGFQVVSWIGDHNPPHVHVYKNNVLVAKFNLRDKVFMFVKDGYAASVAAALRKAKLLWAGTVGDDEGQEDRA